MNSWFLFLGIFGFNENTPLALDGLVFVVKGNYTIKYVTSTP